MQERMTAMAPNLPFDGIIASSPENVYYLSGALILTQRLIPDRLALVFWSQTGRPTFIVCTVEESLARNETWIEDVRGYEEFVVSPIKLLAESIRERGLGQARLGIEAHHLTAVHYEELRRELPAAQFGACDHFFEQMRMVKTPEEIERLRRAAQATDKAIWDAFATATPGRTELEVSAAMQQSLLTQEAEGIAFCILGTGERTLDAHPLPTNRVLQSGDLIRTDLGGMFRGYYSDLARTAVVGLANLRQREIYAKLWSIHSQVIASIQPGVLSRDVYYLCRDSFARNQLHSNMPHVGHGLGIGLHEYPLLAPHVEEPLTPGMVVAFEPIHYEPTGERYHVEDLVEITTVGCRILSRAGDWDRLFETGAR